MEEGINVSKEGERVEARRGRKKKVTKEDMVHVRIMVPRDVWERFRERITHTKPIQEWVGVAIEEFVKRREAQK